ncbi:hypothetical protein BDN72DRAFT_888239 [Pluteus cervinus]|uniref:Uncharacterized protein n=1 Tax=Pluteus cervinus TaxID=181527 RepID=A0ACD3AV92_9AGAR|nr:hypothetical protein BDN72DRAFT_888239 [Pluteus cervinus]
MNHQVDAENLVPRKYQEEVFEKAKLGNIIAALNTGSGKTLISLLLIKWITAQQEMKDKVVVFLVPKVTLVEQQGDYIAENTPLRVAKLHGALELSLMDRAGWKAKFENNDVFVMTAQIFLNIVTHSLWRIDKVSLMVFDECHHARKNHPYNSIMREYFEIPSPGDRPKIFGMTASPIWNPKDALKSLTMLETNLNAKVIGVREHADELAENSPKPIEIIKEYPPPIEGAVFPSPSIFQCFSILDGTVWDLLNIPWYNIEMRYYATLSNLGPYPASYFLYTEIHSHISKLTTVENPPGSPDVEDVDFELYSSTLELKDATVQLPPELHVIQEILEGFAPWFPDPSSPPTETPTPLTLEMCSPKISALVEILLSYTSNPSATKTEDQSKKKGFQGIIFVEQRQNAAVLSLILSNLSELSGKVKCAHLVGAGLSKEGLPNVVGIVGDDKDAVRKFRAGEINLLIATSVAEEGLDFPACDLVVRFDPIQHMVGYVQSRGRARNKASTFVVMIRKDDEAHLTRYAMLKHGEPMLDQVVKEQNLRLEAKASGNGDSGDDWDEENDEAHPNDLLERERYVVPSTGAVLTYDNCLHLLHLLCTLIPHDAFTRPPKPVFSLSSVWSSAPQTHATSAPYSFPRPSSAASTYHQHPPRPYTPQNPTGYSYPYPPLVYHSPYTQPNPATYPYPSSYPGSATSSSVHLPAPQTHQPQATGSYTCSLNLPAGLPLDKADRNFIGPARRSKREAKRAVAFLAVRRLREREVIDEYLLPMGGTTFDGGTAKWQETLRGMGPGTGAGDGKLEKWMTEWLNSRVAELGNIVKVNIVDPWAVDGGEESRLWLHEVEIRERAADGRPRNSGASIARLGLVTGTVLPQGVEMIKQDRFVRLERIQELVFPCEDDEAEARRAMEEFTKLAIWYRITGSPITLPLGAYMVPLTPGGSPDFIAIARLLQNPLGNSDWDALPVSEVAAGNILIMNAQERGRMSILRRIRYDLTPLSTPLIGSREDGHPTYQVYWTQRWTRKQRVPVISPDGFLVEGTLAPRSNYGVYPTWEQQMEPYLPTHTVPDGLLLPQKSTRWILLPASMPESLHLMPSFLYLLSDTYRARRARQALCLPPISDPLLIEALMLPSVNAGFSNQRLETLGDAVLELCVTVFLFERWKWRHEGQLTSMRRGVVTNWFLMKRAIEIGLEEYLGAERRGEGRGKWRFVLGEEEEQIESTSGKRLLTGRAGEERSAKRRRVERTYPRRSLQDCMEAILGAAFLTGGIPMALRAGTAIGMAFGGIVPWEVRYASPLTDPAASSPLFVNLQDTLGYTFRRNDLLIEAITHPSFATSEGRSYQRLEFLGDAILNLVVIKYLYDKFPDATSEQLAFPRTKAVCASALACLAVRKLELHKVMLANSFDLNTEIARYVPLLAGTSGPEIVRRGWRYDPPKALCDVFESVIGAVLVDSGYDYERTAAVAEMVMEEVLEALSPQLKKDPVSELVEWAAANGCTAVKFEKRDVEKVTARGIGIAVVLHGVTVAGPILSSSLTVARFVAAERALSVIQNTDSPKAIKKICLCGTSMDIDEVYQDEDDYYQLNATFPYEDHDAEAEEVEEVFRLLTGIGVEPH